MNTFQSALWTKLASFQIDDSDAIQTFEARLAKEQNWTLAYSRRVIDEYKRFVFLCAASGHGCTPSQDVDEAWHLHLAYTKSYWDRMCGEVLGKPLHHNPSKGGPEEDQKHGNWYQRTHDSYRELFGVEPPADIWPTGSRPKPETLPVIDYWKLPKRPTLIAATIATAAILGGCTQEDSSMMIFVVVLIVLAGILIAAAVNQSKNPSHRNNGGSCSAGTGFTCSSDSGGHHGGGHCSAGGHCSGGDAGGGDGGGGCGSSCGGGCGGGGD